MASSCSTSLLPLGIVCLFNFCRPVGWRDLGLKVLDFHCIIPYPPLPSSPGLPKMEVCQEYYGLPPPPGAIGPFLRLSLGDIVELTKAEAEQNWWEVQAGAMGMTGKDLNVGLGCRWPWGWDHAPTGLWQWKFAPGRVMSMGISGADLALLGWWYFQKLILVGPSLGHSRSWRDRWPSRVAVGWKMDTHKHCDCL